MQTIKEFRDNLTKTVELSNRVFIIPHKNADFDAIASAVGMCLIVRKLGKDVFILFEEEPTKIESGVKRIVGEVSDTFPIINLEKFNAIKTKNDLLITVDVNKNYLVSCNNELEYFKNKIIIDHHEEDENTINASLKHIDLKASSASEIVTELLCLYKIKYNPMIANYLLAGIYLDTNRYTKNCSSKTMNIVSKLLEKGADMNIVNDFFEEDFLSDRKVQELVSKANFFTYTIAMCFQDESVIYTKEELAKVADYLLKYKADAAFAAGFIDENLISISARSKGKLDVGKIMSELDGGGNVFSAASKIENSNIKDISEKLEKILKPWFYKRDIPKV